MVEVPTLIILYNRPDKTRKLLEELGKIKPKEVYIFCDGPKNEGDTAKIADIKKQISTLSWAKRSTHRFEPKNLGCKTGVSTAISWFFQNVESGIILEDDCIPNKSFFTFCSELLKKYKTDDRVSLIAGTNSGVKVETNHSYYFSTYSNIWGWASWADRWSSYSWLEKNGIKLLSTAAVLSDLQAKKIPQNFISNTLSSLRGTLDTWDYMWTMSNILNNRLAIIPKVNMISNIGFGADSTHTKVVTNLANMSRKTMEFPLRHPQWVLPNAVFDTVKRRRHVKFFAGIEYLYEKLLKILSF